MSLLFNILVINGKLGNADETAIGLSAATNVLEDTTGCSRACARAVITDACAKGRHEEEAMDGQQIIIIEQVKETA